jgi:DNA-binding beta-propeller fold protein YncE
MKRLVLIWSALALCAVASAQIVSSGHFMYIGTLDKKLLVIDEDKEEVVGAIPLDGIPRTTALSADHKKLHIITTQMLLETVDLESQKVVSSFSLADPRSRPRIQASAPDRILVGSGSYSRLSGLAVDPTGRFLYTTMKVVIKDIDQYRIEPPQFVAIDLQDKKIAKAWPFPKDLDQGFGFDATYKVSPDGKLLYVFEDDTLVFDLETFQQVDRIELAQPPYPGASPYRLAANDDSFDDPNTVTSVFTSVDAVVHKGTLGMATIDLNTRKVKYFPIGPLLPMVGFLISPDHKRGFSIMPKVGTGENRETEWWVWDLTNHTVINKKTFESRPTFRFGVGGDGQKLYLYGAGSTLEIFDAKTLESRKLIFLNKDTTTNLITIARR